MAITTNGKVSITNLQVGSSADLAGIISDESGTGVLAFTNSPTFTTPALGTPSAVTLTNGTGLPVSGISASTSAAIGVGTIELGHATDTTIARASSGVVSIEGVNVVTTSSTDTLTNKTLTSPVLGGTTTTASGNLAVLPATYILEVQGGASTEGAIQLNCAVNSHGQKIKSQPHAESATNTLLLPGGTTIGNSNAVLVSDTGTQTLTNKTLTSPVVNTAILKSPEERLTVSATAATGTVNFDTLTQGVLYYTTDASGNWTLNVRGDGSTTLNNSLTTGDSITIVFLVTQGATAYYSSALTIDGNAVTPKYISGTAFSAGNASSIDSYVYTIIKTGSATFTVLASQTKFA